MKGRILVVDDDAAVRMALRDRLAHWGFEVEEARDGGAAITATEAREHDVILLDLSMPPPDGMELLRRWKKEAMPAAVVVLTAHGSIQSAVEAIRLGANDFLQKPADFDILRARLHAILDARRQGRHLQALVERVQGDAQDLVAEAPAMRAVLQQARRAADAKATILITGESGAGKQVVAEYVHGNGSMRDGPFVYVNCVALSDELVESTLFGHERGAFTGAVSQKVGRLELARGGTAFLDEIGDTTHRLQAKLLHFLETGEFERVGGTKTRQAECRVIAATNRDLEAAMREGTFREDLFYRLNVIPLHVPPLRERVEDIGPLARAFALRFAREQKVRPITFAPQALERMAHWSWPGNVRELKNLVERLSVLGPGDTVSPDMLPDAFFAPAAADVPEMGEATFKQAVAAFKRSLIAEALARAEGNQTQAAALLGMQRTYLHRLAKELGLLDRS